VGFSNCRYGGFAPFTRSSILLFGCQTTNKKISIFRHHTSNIDADEPAEDPPPNSHASRTSDHHAPAVSMPIDAPTSTAAIKLIANCLRHEPGLEY
jgi:hypothetical protein